MRFKSSAISHIGLVRKLNEDSYAERSDIGVWAVADGMGGHAAGEIASRAVTEAINALQCSDDFEGLHQAVKDSLEAVNQRLRQQSAAYIAKRAPGSTVVVLLISGSQGAVIWAGDSRIYRYRDQTLVQLTRDHSYVQDLLDQGLIGAEETESHRMANIITRAIGIETPLQLDSLAIEIKTGDQYLLCSDGLTRTVRVADIESLMRNTSNDTLVQSLLDATLAEGAPDNVTVMSVQCMADQED